MSGSIFSIIDQAGTLIAILVGAVLATLGALFADLYRERGQRKRRERDAAKAFGQILASIISMMRFTVRSQGIGTPWGNLTVRFMQLCLKQGQWFEENLNLLFDIEDVFLRHKIRTYTGALMYPVQSMVDYSLQIEEMRRQLLFDNNLQPHQKDWLNEQIAQKSEARESAFLAAQHQMSRSDIVLPDLEKLSQVAFDIDEDFLLNLVNVPATPETEKSDA